MKKTFLSLGTNLGDKKKNLSRAVSYINNSIGHIIEISGIYETEPWGFETEDKFMNMAVEVLTSLKPLIVLEKCFEIEAKIGRERDDTKGYSSRVIDIDILFYDDVIESEPELTLPHPHIHTRRFVLEPLNEIAPTYEHPMIGACISDLLSECPDMSMVTRIGALDEEY